MTTKTARLLGWQEDTNTTASYADYMFSPDSADNLVSAAIFINRTGSQWTITSWNQTFQFFGFPQWGDAPYIGAQATSKTMPVKIIFLGGPYYASCGIEYCIVELSGRPPMRFIINYW
jgi:hypothetical protein